MDLYFKFKFVFEYLIPLMLIGLVTLHCIIKHLKNRK
jgi:hypothetical protein